MSSQRKLKDSATEMDRRWRCCLMTADAAAALAAAAQARVEPWCKRPRGPMVTLVLVNPTWSKT
jgi:hypothetical protein